MLAPLFFFYTRLDAWLCALESWPKPYKVYEASNHIMTIALGGFFITYTPPGGEGTWASAEAKSHSTL